LIANDQISITKVLVRKARPEVFWFTTSRTGVSRHAGLMCPEIPDTLADLEGGHPVGAAVSG
jgi:hypothetical protein